MKTKRQFLVIALAALATAGGRVQAGENLAATAARPLFAMDTYTQRPYPHGTMPVEQQMDLLKELGYAGVAWTADEPARVKSARELAEARGLKMVAIYCQATLSKDGLKGEERLPGIIGAVKGSGCVIWLHITSGDFAKSAPEGDEAALAGLREISDWAEQAGLKVAVYPHLGDWTERVQDAVRVANKVDRKNFGVSFNLCHCLKVGDEEKIPALLQEAAPRLFLVTVNGADTGSASSGWDRLIQTLDRGSFDLKPVLRKLKELNYSGPVACQGYGIPGDIRDTLTRTMNAWRKLAAE
ncbi:MAG: sugar phosphate isomerase/epimerase family protein [bacterium]